VDDHFGTPEGVVESGRQSVLLMNDVMKIIDDVRASDMRISAKNAVTSVQVTVNPAEARRIERSNCYESRLGEDRRFLIYGIDAITIMTGLAAYYNALYKEDKYEENKEWRIVEQAADRLDSYYVPIGYAWPGAGLESKDGLSRCQLREVLRRCRKYRYENILGCKK
jgi:hypothetical protein